jgi:hypothetical protein
MPITPSTPNALFHLFPIAFLLENANAASDAGALALTCYSLLMVSNAVNKPGTAPITSEAPSFSTGDSSYFFCLRRKEEL